MIRGAVAWFLSGRRRRRTSRFDRLQINVLVKFDFGPVACELSRETYGVDLKWVLLRKLG